MIDIISIRNSNGKLSFTNLLKICLDLYKMLTRQT